MFRSWVVTSSGYGPAPGRRVQDTKADMDTVLITVGLKSKEPDLKPPPQPEQYVLPPEMIRFSAKWSPTRMGLSTRIS